MERETLSQRLADRERWPDNRLMDGYKGALKAQAEHDRLVAAVTHMREVKGLKKYDIERARRQTNLLVELTAAELKKRGLL